MSGQIMAMHTLLRCGLVLRICAADVCYGFGAANVHYERTMCAVTGNARCQLALL